MPYQVFASTIFMNELEDASEWLYYHNEQQSLHFADKKRDQLFSEVTSLRNRLSKRPYSIGTEIIAKLATYRKAPVYHDRYQAEWLITEAKLNVSLLRFKDSKHPAEIRYKEFIFDDSE